MYNLFVYGTLKDQNILKDLIQRIPEQEKDSIQGWELSSIKSGGETYPAIILSKDSEKIVMGKVLRVSKAELSILDDYEGKEYSRIKVLTLNDLHAEVYVKKYK